ncbi:hypothetical protein LguiB_008488 [Lonicera macranthoides]
MSLKITWRTIITSCFKLQNQPPTHPKKTQNVCKQNSSNRLLLSDISNSGSQLSLISDLCNSLIGWNLHIFTLAEMKLITHNFSSSNYLGEGGFGPVHKGFIDDKMRPALEAQPVAVKLLDLDGSQGYSVSLPWLARLKIAVGAAKGLAFLHGEDKPVIYRDFKSSNILLDPDYTAKLSDFGLAKDGPEGDETHVTTRVMGTHGYAAPEYIMTGHLTTMSDVFSYGVVLLELLTGRRAMDKTRPSRGQSLVEWARPLLKDSQRLDRIMDPKLEGQYSMQGAKKAAAVAYQCLSHNPKSRPTMSNVVSTLEPLLGLDDIPVSFVYIVPTEGQKGNDTPKKRNGNGAKEEKRKDGEEKDLERKDNGCNRGKICHRHRQRIRTSRSRAVYSDTALYYTLRHGGVN